MKKFLYLFALAMIFISCEAQQKKGAELISPEKFSQEINKRDALLIDVRTPEEFNAGHIEGAQNINLHDESFTSNINKLDKEKTVFVYCKAGRRSSEAATTLKQNGFKNVVELDGGTTAWTAAGKPLK